LGNPGQVLIQLHGIAATIAGSALATFVLLKVIGLIVPLRVSEECEIDGFDLTSMAKRFSKTQAGSFSPNVSVELTPGPSSLGRNFPHRLPSPCLACTSRQRANCERSRAINCVCRPFGEVQRHPYDFRSQGRELVLIR